MSGLTTVDLDLIHAARRDGIRYFGDRVFTVDGVQATPVQADRLTDLIFGGLLRLDNQWVAVTSDGLIAAGVPC